MPVRRILLLGNPLLYRTSDLVEPGESSEFVPLIEDLHDTLMDFRSRTGAGRAIAAPQVGVHKRIVYMFAEEPVVFINPELDQFSEDSFEVWDDCMCFPGLYVRVKRHRSCRITWRSPEWMKKESFLANERSELLQHEVDHLDGILATQRAIDARSFSMIA